MAMPYLTAKFNKSANIFFHNGNLGLKHQI